MKIPLWRHEAKIEALVAAIADADGIFLAEIVSEPGAPGARFTRTLMERLVSRSLVVLNVRADRASMIHPGLLADEIERDSPSAEPVVTVVEDAHLADWLSLGRIAQRGIEGSTKALVIVRDGLRGADLRPFKNLSAIAARVGVYHQITLNAPTVDDIEQALDIDHSAAVALHKAAGGDDEVLVDSLGELELSTNGSLIQDLGEFLTRLADNASPLGQFDELDRQLVELITVSLSPVSSTELSTATGAPEREVLDAVERLVVSGLAHDGASGIDRVDNHRSRAVARSLSSSRAISANRNLANALSAAGDTGIEVGIYFEQAGDSTQAFKSFLATANAAENRGDGPLESVAADRALMCLDAGATTDPGTRGRLLLVRARMLRFSGYSSRALEDLRDAVLVLTGIDRIDALGYLAAVLDDQQLPQEADVTIAIGEWEAHQMSAPDKLGSLLSLRARTAARLGFAREADHALELSLELTATHGSTPQQRNVSNNRAWMAFDRGEVAKAEQLFAELTEQAGDTTNEADARAWQARALALRGWVTESQEALALVRANAGDASTVGAQFLAAIGAHELAMRTGRFSDALDATTTELGYVTLFLPAWENGTRYRQADALRALGQFEEAKAAISESLALSPPGANGTRWRLRAQSLEMRIAGESDGAWDQRAAEDLTDVLLHSGWLSAAAELMVARAAAQDDTQIAAEASALAMRLGDPIMAAAAIDAAGSWTDQPAVARAVQSLDSKVPDEMQNPWRGLPGVADALDQQLSDEYSEPDWHGDLRVWLDEAGLGEDRISPAQRRDRRLVRRTTAPRRWGTAVLAASVAASVVLIAIFGLNVSGAETPTTTISPGALETAVTVTTTAPSTTTTTLPPVEERLIAIPENGLFGNVQYLGAPDHNFLLEQTGITTFTGFYWVYPDVGVVVSQPIVQGRLLYVADRDGLIHVISLDTGNALNTYKMNDDIEAPLAIGSFALGENGAKITRGYAVDVSGTVKTFDANDLLTQDGYQLGARTTAGPVIVLNRATSVPSAIIFASHDGRIRALDVDVSREIAVYPPLDEPPLGRVEVTPALHDGRLFVVDSEGVLTVLDAVTLALDCQADARRPATAAPVVADDLVWIPTSNAIRIIQTDCLQPPATDRVEIPADMDTTPVVDAPVVYIADGSVVLAHDTTSDARIIDGESADRWAEAADAGIRSSLVLANGIVYYGDNRTLIARRADDGVEIARYEIGTRISVAPVLIDAAIIVSVNGRIIAIAGS